MRADFLYWQGPGAVALGAPLVTFPATGKSPGAWGGAPKKVGAEAGGPHLGSRIGAGGYASSFRSFSGTTTTTFSFPKIFSNWKYSGLLKVIHSFCGAQTSFLVSRKK